MRSFFLLFLVTLAACTAPRSQTNVANAQAFADTPGKVVLSGTATISYTYCGGPYLPPEKIAEMQRPQPLVRQAIYFYPTELEPTRVGSRTVSPFNDSTFRAQLPDTFPLQVAEVWTDSLGRFTTRLPAGRYCVCLRKNARCDYPVLNQTDGYTSLGFELKAGTPLADLHWAFRKLCGYVRRP